ncbi:MAG: hypothetical protein ACTSU9_07390 [Promethearchaeota archaeon]
MNEKINSHEEIFMVIEKAGAIKAIAVIAIIGGASVGLIFGGILLNSSRPSEAIDDIWISEIQYASTNIHPVNDQYFEIYVHDDVTNASFRDFHIESRNRTGDLIVNVDVPELSDIGKYWHVLIYAKNGTNSRDTLDKSITVYLNLTIGTWFDTLSGAIVIRKGSSPIDSVAYGNYSSPVWNWPISDGGMWVNETSQSLNIWGPDADNSSNWYPDTQTPGSFNNLHHNITDWMSNGSSDNITAVMYNGFINVNMSLEQMIYPTLPPTDPLLPLPPLAKVDNDPTSGVSTSEIQEYVMFTMIMLGLEGLFPDGPMLGTDGVVDIHIGTDENFNSSSGKTHADGSVYITIGQEVKSADPARRQRGKYDVKYTVEHEIVHVFQMQVTGGFRKVQDDNNRAWSEGEATYWGQKSTAANFNITVWKLNEEMQKINNNKGQTNTHPQNWNDHGKNTNTPSWGNGNLEGNNKFVEIFDYYQLGALLVKFLREKFGPGVYKNITNSLKNKDGGAAAGEKNIRDAIAENTGMSFTDFLLKFYIWRNSGGAEADNNVTAAVVTDSFNYAGASVQTTSHYVFPLGAAHETVNVTNPADPPFEINITANPKGTEHGDYSVGVTSTLRNGSKVTSTFIVKDGTSVQVPIDPSQVAFVSVVKMNLNDTHVTAVGMGIIVTPIQEPSVPPVFPPDLFTPMIPSYMICDGYRGGAYDGYYCILDTFGTAQPYDGITGPGWYNLTSLEIIVDPILSNGQDWDLQARFWKFNITASEQHLDPYYDPTPWFDGDAVISTDVNITLADIGTCPDGLHVVTEIRDLNSNHTLSFFSLSHDAVYTP